MSAHPGFLMQPLPGTLPAGRAPPAESAGHASGIGVGDLHVTDAP